MSQLRLRRMSLVLCLVTLFSLLPVSDVLAQTATPAAEFTTSVGGMVVKKLQYSDRAPLDCDTSSSNCTVTREGFQFLFVWLGRKDGSNFDNSTITAVVDEAFGRNGSTSAYVISDDGSRSNASIVGSSSQDRSQIYITFGVSNQARGFKLYWPKNDVVDLGIVPLPGELCFKETGKCISGRLREYWEQNGGLPVFGFPITVQRQELIEGKPFQVQWFERNRLELHPENARPYDVLLGRLGDDRLKQQNRDWKTFPQVTSAPADCLFFAETGHSICGAILRAFRANGLEFDGQPGKSIAENLALFGLPLSEPQSETFADGKSFVSQWFERARFELHPENQAPFDVLLGLLGNEIRTGQPSFDGNWSGTSSQGQTITFSVAKGAVAPLKMEFTLQGCSLRSVSTSESAPSPIAGDSFTVTFNDTNFSATLTGKFDSATTASGKFEIQFKTSALCPSGTSLKDITWTATKK